MSIRLLSFYFIGLAALCSAAALIACRGGDPPPMVQKRNVPIVLSEKDPQFVFNKKCGTCHGEDLAGGSGPALLDLSSRMDEMTLLEILARGKGDAMPAGLVEGEMALTSTLAPFAS